MSINSSRTVLGVMSAVFAMTSACVIAQDRPYDDRYEPGYDRHDDRYDHRDYHGDDRGAIYDYARVVDVQPLMTRVRVSTPQRECWEETRYEARRGPRDPAAGAVLGAVVGAVIGHQIGHGRGRDAATAAGAVIGAGIGHREAQRNNGPPEQYTVQRCETRYSDEWQERVEGYRVTYLYNGRRQVTELPYRPGDRIRVRVDVSPAE